MYDNKICKLWEIEINLVDCKSKLYIEKNYEILNVD